ncbi:MAG: hypothetical protein J6C92_07180 [Bacteroidaceae bacterium]|nr:hypothetical protein [Bacteroidaceae bacterium]
MTNNVATMNRDLITLNEVLNNGHSIYFYQEELTGMWMTYGNSAYLLSQTDGLHTLSGYSEKMQMPYVCITNADFRKIASEHAKLMECRNGVYHLTASLGVDTDGYQHWTESLK